MDCNKIIILIVASVLLLGGSVYADSVVSTSHFSGGLDSAGSHGEWSTMNGRLYQNDVKEPLAKVNFEAPQRGTMEYRFDVRYEGGGFADRMGGFGIHLFVDSAFPGRSWGNGESYLFWLNYDEDATYGRSGFQAQVYKSDSDVEMNLLEDYQARLPVSYLNRSNLDVTVPVKMQVNGNNGQVKVWDPTNMDRYYEFYLDSAPGRGNYISLRTNSLSVSFDNLVVTRVSN